MRVSFVLAGILCIALLGIAYLSFSDYTPAPPKAPTNTPEARSQWEFERTKDPATGQLPPDIKQQELVFSRAMARRTQPLAKRASAVWTQAGPDTLGGRTRALAVDVTDNNTLIAGAVSGGIWKSTDGGASWTQTLTPTQLLSVTSLTQDTRTGNTDTWYAGTGELSGNSASASGAYFYGDGIYKSTDGGDSWTLLASTSTDRPESFDQEMDFIWRVVTDASNLAQDEVYAATYGGIYRSVDGGTSWTEVLSSSGALYTDIVISSTGVLYAVLTGTNAGVWRSTDGVTWADITPGGWAGSSARSALALAPSNEDVLYTLTNTSGAGTYDHSLWKYTHSTTTWEDRSANIPGFGSFQNGVFDSQGGYDLHIAVKPDDEHTVFIGGTSLYRSRDGFQTTSTAWIGGYSGATDDWSGPHHADQHIVIFSPSDPDIMYTGSDGGIHRTNNNLAAEVSWTSLNRGYLSGQFYSVAVDHTSSTNMALLGGTQDNGTWFVDDPDASTLGEEIWGGDGAFVTLLDDGDLRYASFQNGQIYRLTYNTSNQLTSWALVSTSLISSYLFIHPFVLDPNDSEIMYLPGSQRIYRNTSLSSIPNYQSSTHTIGWQTLSNSTTSGGVISALVASESNPDHRLYYGTSVGKVYRIDNADTGDPSAVDISSGLFPGSAYVNSIAVHPENADEVVVVFSNYSVQSVFHSDDAGATWTNISGSLEENVDGSGSGPSVRWVEIGKISSSESQYFVGTSTGLYSTTTLNGTSTVWTQEGPTSIGNVIVDMIDIRNSDGYVAIGTHGNGYYTSTLDRPEPQVAPGGVDSNLELWLKADAGVSESGGNVTSWADQSSATRNAGATAGANLPAVSATSINYNPAIEFDRANTESLETPSVYGTATHSDINLFAVTKNNTLTESFLLGEGANISSRVAVAAPWSSDLNVYWDAGAISGANRLVNGWTGTVGTPYIWGFEYESSSPVQAIYRDGASVASDASASSFALSSETTFKIGSFLGASFVDADVAELIAYNGELSDAEQDRVETYLAIKYGITLSHDYVASDATTLWDATANASYHNDVFGLVRDDGSALNQKQSGAGILAVALGAFAADNATNANTFSADLDALFLGHDSGSLTESPVTISATTGQLLGRTWIAEEAGETGTLEVQFDLSGLSVTGISEQDFYLVLDTDTDPTNGTRQLIRAASFVSDVATFSNVDIADGDYVMLLTDYVAGTTDPPLADGQAASGVLGQSNMGSGGANNGGVSASTTDGPSFLAIGPTGKLFVSDTDNNRILRWSSASAASNGSAAEAVLGQANFTASAANRGGTVAANTLYEPHGLFVSSTGALYVADSRNNRILRFDNAENASNGVAADAVLGQADFVSNDANRSGSPAANTLRWPMDLYVDGSGILWASDWLNHRVLRYDNVAAKGNGGDADGVLGQASFASSSRMWKDNTDGDSFVYPSGVCVDQDGVLWVADSGNSRVLRFDAAAGKANGASADGVLGQPDFTSWRTIRGTGTAANTLQWPDAGLDVDNNGRLWVADRWGDRVIWFHNAASKANGADADGVIGQPGFTTRDGVVDNDTFNGANDVLVDESNDFVWVADNNHNRVLRFDGTDLALGKNNTLSVANMLDFWMVAGADAYADPQVSAYATSDDEVHVWLDQSRHGFTALADTPPVFVDGIVNGYPAVRFDRDNARMRINGGIFGEPDLSGATVWAIVAAEGAVAGEDFALQITSRGAGRIDDGNPDNNTPVATSSDYGNATLLMGEIDPTTGMVAELMATFQSPSETESDMIATYLALKYGVPYEQNYLSTTGDTLWHRAQRTAFGAGVAGIGRNDALALSQTTAKAMGIEHVLRFTKPAAPGVDAFTEDNSYVLWGHNGESLAINKPAPLADAPYLMNRTWLVQETGRVDSLRIEIPAGTRAEYMLIDHTDTFADPVIVPLLHDQDAVHLAAYVDIDQTAYVTFAARSIYEGYNALPGELTLHQNYPNPFNPVTTIQFELPEPAATSLVLYDILGRQVDVLVDEEMRAGSHSITFDAAGLASGVYFYRLQVRDQVRTKKMLLAK